MIRTKPVGPVAIDWTHKLSRGQAAWWLANTARLHDLVGKTNGTFGVAMPLVPTQMGLGYYANGTGYGVIQDTTQVIDLDIDEFTIGAWFIHTSTPSPYKMLFARDNGSNAAYAFGFDSGGAPYLAINDGGWAEYASAGAPLSNNQIHFHIVSRDAAANLVTCIDGAPGNTNASVKKPRAVLNEARICDSPAGSQIFPGTLISLQVWRHRALKLGEMQELYRNPWGQLRRAAVSVKAAAGGGPPAFANPFGLLGVGRAA